MSVVPKLQLSSTLAQRHDIETTCQLFQVCMLQGAWVNKLARPITEGLSPVQRRHLATWLGVCSGWVFTLVVLGGITRLTRSGLSMTEWKFAGDPLPPSAPFSHYLHAARLSMVPHLRDA
jgi:heme a synthase